MLLDEQLKVLQAEFPGTDSHPLPTGTQLITIPGFALADGWNKPSVTVRLVVPIGYPHAQPDCFWVDADLRLKNGAPPQNTNMQAVPGTAEPLLWFSWHAGRWNPNRDSLSTFVRLIGKRLLMVQ